MAGPSELELDRLMDRLADGDRDAFTPLFEALYPRALAVACRRLDRSDAEDVAQRTMIAVFARAMEFTPGRPVLPWFYAIAANETHAIARRVQAASTRNAPLTEVEQVTADGDPESVLSVAEMRGLLHGALASLDPLSAAAIEGQLTDPPNGPLSATARKRVSRAYARLRALLGVT